VLERARAIAVPPSDPPQAKNEETRPSVLEGVRAIAFPPSGPPLLPPEEPIPQVRGPCYEPPLTPPDMDELGGEQCLDAQKPDENTVKAVKETVKAVKELIENPPTFRLPFPIGPFIPKFFFEPFLHDDDPSYRPEA
jgi:hypothetical protein